MKKSQYKFEPGRSYVFGILASKASPNDEVPRFMTKPPSVQMTTEFLKGKKIFTFEDFLEKNLWLFPPEKTIYCYSVEGVDGHPIFTYFAAGNPSAAPLPEMAGLSDGEILQRQINPSIGAGANNASYESVIEILRLQLKTQADSYEARIAELNKKLDAAETKNTALNDENVGLKGERRIFEIENQRMETMLNDGGGKKSGLGDLAGVLEQIAPHFVNSEGFQHLMSKAARLITKEEMPAAAAPTAGEIADAAKVPMPVNGVMAGMGI